MTEPAYIGKPALRCGRENIRALVRIVTSHAAIRPAAAPLSDKQLAKLHPYLKDPDILAAVKTAAGLS